MARILGACVTGQRGARLGIMPGLPQQGPKARIDLRLERKEDYLLAVVSGERVTLLDSLDYARQMIQECHQQGLSRILYVRDIVHPLSLPDAFLAVSQLVDLGREGLTIAFVDLHKGHETVNRYCEMVAERHGLQHRVFGSVAEAEAWLLSSPGMATQARQNGRAGPPARGADVR